MVIIDMFPVSIKYILLVEKALTLCISSVDILDILGTGYIGDVPVFALFYMM